MGTITAQDIADRAWAILQDTVGTPGTRWTAPFILAAVNDGQREVVVYLPSAYTLTAIRTLSAGTRQTLEGIGIADGVSLVKVTRNFDVGGSVPGRAITPRSVAWIDEYLPNWHADEAGEVVHFFFDPADPKAFYVWRPANGSRKAEVVYHAIPADLPAISSAITLDDIYANALTHYVLFRSFSMNAAYTKNPALAQYHYQLFLQSLGVKGQTQAAGDPNRRMASDGAGVAAAT